MYEDGLALKNGFFRSRKFVPQSEGSLDLFAEERQEESGGEEGEGEVEDTQMEALRRRDRLEREEYMKKCRVGSDLHLSSCKTLTFSPLCPLTRRRIPPVSWTRTVRVFSTSSETPLLPSPVSHVTVT